jgi:hypothetical protein
MGKHSYEEVNGVEVLPTGSIAVSDIITQLEAERQAREEDERNDSRRVLDGQSSVGDWTGTATPIYDTLVYERTVSDSGTTYRRGSRKFVYIPGGLA